MPQNSRSQRTAYTGRGGRVTSNTHSTYIGPDLAVDYTLVNWLNEWPAANVPPFAADGYVSRDFPDDDPDLLWYVNTLFNIS